MINLTKGDKKFILDNFEGPLDLLLHLIKDKKLDLLEISLVQIADQFIEYVNQAKLFNLDIASEYLLISSQLVEMKGKYMLKTNLFLEPDEYEQLDQENLLERLIQYERYKKKSNELNELYEKAPRYEKLEDDFVSYIEEEGERIVNILTKGKKDFEKSWENIILRLKNKTPLETRLAVRKISIEQRRKELENELNKGDTTFISMVDVFSKYYIAITLLVLLEMAARGLVKLVQKDDFSDIEIRKAINEIRK